jgi:hypothetical protein
MFLPGCYDLSRFTAVRALRNDYFVIPACVDITSGAGIGGFNKSFQAALHHRRGFALSGFLAALVSGD